MSASTISRIRTKEEIQDSMIKNGMLDKDGNYTGKMPDPSTGSATIKSYVASPEEKAEAKAKTKKTKTKKVKAKAKAKKVKVEKIILITEKINDFETKEKMFDEAMTKVYGDRYNVKTGTVRFDVEGKKPLYVNTYIQPMKIVSSATSNTVGLRATVVKNGAKYTLGEYAGKWSMTIFAKHIDKIANEAING